MNTISPNEDMFADFYQVGGYSNLAGGTARLMARGGSGQGGLFTELAQRGRGTKFVNIMYRQFTRVYDEIKQDFDLSDAEINRLYGDYRNQGGSKLSGFKQFISDVESSKSKVQEQIINDVSTPQVEPQLETPMPPKKSNINYLYIGLGAIVLVGATVLIVRK
jgi:hypothetical protein